MLYMLLFTYIHYLHIHLALATLVAFSHQIHEVGTWDGFTVQSVSKLLNGSLIFEWLCLSWSTSVSIHALFTP